MHTSGSTYRSRCESTINGSCVPIIRRIMSGRMKKQAVCLQMLIKTKNAKLRKAILEHADPELIRALCECAHNILRGNVKMTPREKTRLRKYQTKLRLIARKNVSVKQKRRHLQQTGGFLPALLAPLAASASYRCYVNCLRDEGDQGMTKGTRGPEGPAMTKGPGDRRRGPEGSRY